MSDPPSGRRGPRRPHRPWRRRLLEPDRHLGRSELSRAARRTSTAGTARSSPRRPGPSSTGPPPRDTWPSGPVAGRAPSDTAGTTPARPSPRRERDRRRRADLPARCRNGWPSAPRPSPRSRLPRPVHRIPHRSNDVLIGLVNLRGQLQLCVSLHGLLGVEVAGASPHARRIEPRGRPRSKAGAGRHRPRAHGWSSSAIASGRRPGSSRPTRSWASTGSRAARCAASPRPWPTRRSASARRSSPGRAGASVSSTSSGSSPRCGASGNERRPERILDDGPVPDGGGGAAGGAVAGPGGAGGHRRDGRDDRAADARGALAEGGGADRGAGRGGAGGARDGRLPRRGAEGAGRARAGARRRPAPRRRPAGAGLAGRRGGAGGLAGGARPARSRRWWPTSPPSRRGDRRQPPTDVRRRRPADARARRGRRRAASRRAAARARRQRRPRRRRRRGARRSPPRRRPRPAGRRRGAGRPGGAGDGGEPDAADGPGGRIAGPDAPAPPVRRFAPAPQGAADRAAGDAPAPGGSAVRAHGGRCRPPSASCWPRPGSRPRGAWKGWARRSRRSRSSPAAARTSRAGSTTRSSPAGCGRWPTASAASRGWSATSRGSWASRRSSRSSARPPGVDRDILDSLEAPLNHLIRNALDHGIEMPEERAAAGKSPAGTIRLEARHRAGMLQIVLGDDGRGIDLERLRAKVVERGLTTAAMAGRLSEAELLEFLFLPGFSTKEKVTEISGRGVGLDVVQSMVQAVRGSVRVTSQLGKGTRFILQLPITVSVIRALLVEIAGEPYAFPLNRIDRILMLDRQDDPRRSRASRTCCWTTSRWAWSRRPRCSSCPSRPARTAACRSWSPATAATASAWWSTSSWASATSGRAARPPAGQGAQPQQLLGPRGRLAGPDHRRRGPGPLDRQPAERPPAQEADRRRGGRARAARGPKRVLVVDDSITVRELERQLLENRGYAVDVAVDGVDGWNAVRTRPIRPGRQRHRHAADGRHPARRAHQARPPAPGDPGDHRLVQGPRGGPDPRPRRRGQLST